MAWNQSQFGVTQMSHSHIFISIEKYNHLESQQRSGNHRIATTGASNTRASGATNVRAKDPYDVPGVDALLLKSPRGEPELAPCSSASDNDEDDKDNDNDLVEDAKSYLAKLVTLIELPLTTTT